MKLGDKVEVIDEAVSGVVTHLKGNYVYIETEDGFELEYTANELVKIDDLLTEKKSENFEITSVLAEKEEKRPKKAQKPTSRRKKSPPMEVDLHIQQLVKHYKRLSNHEILTLQLDTAQRQLRFAIDKRIQRIVFIHGIGEGVLRAELEFLLNRYENLKFFDADYQKYGQGALEVYLFQQK